MVDPQASRFWRLGLQSGLIDAKKLQACWEAIAPEKRVADQADRRLARQAIQAGYLTLWQAQQLLSGRASGFQIDRYVVLEPIGQGGMGRVYLARDTRLDRRVAVKILSPERMNNPRAIARFRREARVGAQLQHENLVRIYDVGEARGKWFLVMEYIEGKTVGALIAERGALPPTTAVRLVRQVALGLEHAYEKSLIHRDVNPYNMLVTRDGTAKLTDLGLAIDLTDQTPVTREGATVGTFDYIAPEQARHSHAVDTRSDIYSLGCSLYHMLSGQVPFPSSSLPEKLFGHHALEPAPLESLVPGIPEGLPAVVSRMMRKSPDERYPTPLKAALALEPFAGDLPNNEKDATVLSALGVTIPPPTLSETQVAETVGQRLHAFNSDAPVPQPAVTPAASLTPTSPDDSLLSSALSLDFGPEPPLTESISRIKRDWIEWLGNWWPLTRGQLLGLGAAVVLVVLGAIFFASKMLGKSSESATVGAQPPGASSRRSEVRQPVNSSRQGPATAAAPGSASVDGFTIETSDGKVVEPDLPYAMRRAIGTKGRIVLDDRAPSKFTHFNRSMEISGGSLVISAAEGAQPVWHVEVGDRDPFLTTQSDTKLHLVGLTILVHFAEQKDEPPPLIKATGGVTLERCCFKATGAVRGARAITAEGTSLTATGCWFEGFGQALEISAYPGSEATFRQCMAIPSRTDSQPSGWLARVHRMAGGGSGSPRLSIDRCTFKGKGLLDLIDFSAENPYVVELKQTAVLGNALLCWQPATKDPSTIRAALKWSGEGNQYDLHGASWIVLDPEGNTVLEGGPTDLDSWRRLASETSTLNPPVRFLPLATTSAEPQSVWDFAVVNPGLQPVGADPDLVGSSAKANRGPASGR